MYIRGFSLQMDRGIEVGNQLGCNQLDVYTQQQEVLADDSYDGLYVYVYKEKECVIIYGTNKMLHLLIKDILEYELVILT